MSIAHLGLGDSAPPPDEYGPERVPPHDLAAEQYAIGGMLLSAEAVADVLEVVTPRDFYIPKHQVIVEAIMAQSAKGEPCDVIAVTDELLKTKQLQRAGGAEYLHTLMSLPSTSANAGFYASIVAEKAVLRRMVEAGTRIVQMGYASEGEVVELLEDARKQLDDVDGVQARDVSTMATTVLETIESIEKPVRQVPTPWRTLNNSLGGFRPGALYVIGARPGVGKTAVGLQSAMELARTGTVAFCSLEMPERELHLRAMAQGAGVPLRALLGYRALSAEEWQRIAAWRASTPLRVAFDDRSGISVFDVRTFARQVARQAPKDAPLAGVVVDYLQLMTDRRDIPRHEKVADMSRQLKILARDLDVPVLALSQLNRGVEGRSDKRPQMSDLRESGAIEQDADVVILLHRDMEPSERTSTDRLQMLVAKNRQGESGVAAVVWQGEYVRALDFGARPANGQVPMSFGGE